MSARTAAEILGRGEVLSTVTRIPQDDHPLTESGDAEFFAEMYGYEVRYDHARRRWLQFKDGLWRPQAAGEVEHLALVAIRDRQRLALGNEARLKWAAGGESAGRRRHLLELAQKEPAIRDDGTGWDAEPNLVGTPGTPSTPSRIVDLRTGKVREGRPSDRVTKRTRAGWDPEARSDLWDRVLTRALPDEDVRHFLRTLAGLTLAGVTGENLLPIIYGVTRSAKGTVIDALRSALGDYAVAADLSTFAEKRNVDGGAARPDLMGLLGARMVAVYEAGRRFRLDMALVKALSGSDPIKARTLYQAKEVEFRPTFLVWLATDTRPSVPEDDAAFFERLCEVPFNVYIPPDERDKTVRERLTREEHGAAVLAWAWAGYQDYITTGLVRPEAVKRAGEDYRAAMNPARPFIEECLVVRPGDEVTWTATDALRAEYERWSRENGERPVSGKRLATALAAASCRPEKRKGVRGWAGVGLRAADEHGGSNGGLAFG